MADLDYIRELLVAQTIEPEPRAQGLLGRWFAGKHEPSHSASRSADARGARPRRTAPFRSAVVKPLDLCSADAEPPPKRTPAPPLDIEAASVLPLASPRSEFGRRPDLVGEGELILDEPATEPRRLKLLDPLGQAVGEMILQPDAPTKWRSAAAPREVPYFPEDLQDSHPRDPEPLRPWLKSLRKSGVPQSRPEPDAFAQDTIAVAKPAPSPLGRDLLQALELTLAREHEDLDDRLCALAQTAPFQVSEAVGAVA